MVQHGTLQARVEERRQQLLEEYAGGAVYRSLPEPLRENLVYNMAHRDVGSCRRCCPVCAKHFAVQPEDSSGRDREKEEAHRSGICSEECFIKHTGMPLCVADCENERPGRLPPDVRARLSAWFAFCEAVRSCAV